MEETSNVPKLRFGGYLREWKIKPLGAIAKIQRGASPRPINSKKWYDMEEKNVGWVRIGDVTNSSKYLYETKDYFSNDGIKKSRFLPKGSLIMSICATIGKPVITGIDTCIHDGFVGFTNLNSVNKEFLYYLLNILEPKFSSLSQTGSQANLNSDLVRITKVGVPTYEEQTKIVSFLTTVDKKINLLYKKQDYLKDFKKFCLQNLFIGKLRFNYLNSGGFKNKNDFKTVKLESLIKKGKAGGTPKSSIGRYYKGNIPFLSISDMTMQGKYITFTSKKITKEAINDSSAWIIPKNSLLYSIYASIGFVSINKIDLSTSQAIFGIILKDNVNIDYIYYYLTYFKRFVHKFIETGTQGNLNKNILYNFIIKIPNSIEEQEKIASFLSLIDKKIDLTQKQIDLMEKFKKGLLQQMFV